MLDFQHCTAVRAVSRSVPPSGQLQLERYEADMKLISKGLFGSHFTGGVDASVAPGIRSVPVLA
jgi:hypothetical protein